MRKILIEQITVLVLLRRRVEKPCAVLQAKPPDPLLHEVKVFISGSNGKTQPSGSLMVVDNPALRSLIRSLILDSHL